MAIGPRYVGSTELPWDTGRHDGPEVRPDEVNVDYQDGRWSLTGLSQDHLLFSAVPLALIGLAKDPVAVYWTENNLPEGESPYWVEMDRVVLAGLPPPYDRILFACPKPYADGLIKFLDRVSAASEEYGGYVVHSIRQRLPVVDWRLADRVSVAPPNPPTVHVDLYGLDAPGELLVWRPPVDPWTSPITLVRRRKRKPKHKKS